MNSKWLKIQQMHEEEQSRVERAPIDQNRMYIRRYSKRGAYPVISFVNFDDYPELFRQIPPIPWRDQHPEYGKYRDPVTGLHYNTIDEFKQIRNKCGIIWKY